MARQEILLGSTPDGEGGDNARTAFGRVNEMTAELYQRVGAAEESQGATGAAVETLQAEVSSAAESIGHLQTSREFNLTAGENINIDRTDPENPVISATSGGGGLGTVTSVAGVSPEGGDVPVEALADAIGLGGKVDKAAGKGLSTEDYTTAEKERLAAAVLGTDQRLSDAREWSAETVSQTEAETGTGTTRRAWSAQRVRQAIAAWWNGVSTAFGRGLVAADDAAAGRVALGLGSAATRAALGAGALYARDSILGVVSQTAGVPTGAIIERGSNANGEYIKYADGTLICQGNFSSAVAASASSNFFFAWTYPYSFSARPFVDGVAQPSVSAEIYGYLYDSSGGSLAQTTFVFRNGATAQNFDVRTFAIGRWY